MKEIIEVKRADGTFSQVVIGDVMASLEEYLPERRVVVITDSNVHRLYKDVIDRYEPIIIGMGETIKTMQTVEKILTSLIEKGADRESFILGIGGGIVTDIAGFVASVYMRGVRFGFVATTLLAQVDASVGGKNGVNLEGFKNMVGTFNQPDFVLCDSSVTSTLPARELRAGVAEIIKAGIISDPALFAMFEQYNPEEIRQDRALLMRAVTAAVRVKAGVVERDERESGERKKLNLGHTFAHAIEKSTSEFLHGEAVAIGIVMAADVSVSMGLLDVATAVKIKHTIGKAGLPVESKLDARRIFSALHADKKKDNDSVSLILIRGIGDCVVEKIMFAELEKYL